MSATQHTETPVRSRIPRTTNHLPPLLVLLIPLLLWLVLFAGDWYMRFRWFRWQDSWRVRKAVSSSSAEPSSRLSFRPESKGGDLTKLAALSCIEEKYGELRPAAEIWTDEFGYMNRPSSGEAYPIVVIGDSYMGDGVTMEDTISGQLSEVSGLPVYNHALVGLGSFISAVRFLKNERFQEDRPRVVVWGVMEREIAGDYFEGLVYQIYTMIHGSKDRSDSAGSVNFRAFSPKVLKRSLPNTSAIALLSRKWQNRLRYYVLRQMHPWVRPAQGLIAGRPVLFYFPSIDAMSWGPEKRNVKRVAWCVEWLHKACEDRGIQLVILLIPDKEQVYRDRIPELWNPPDNPLPPSCLPGLEHELRQRNMNVVNLLEPFRQKAAEDELLYWADDTHWNPKGIRLAAELAWEKIRPLVEPVE